MTNRVVITGLGAISPVGNTVNESWDALVKGQSGINKVSLFDASELPAQIAGEVKNFDPVTLVGKKEARRLDRFTQLTLEAGRQAIEDAGLHQDNVDKDRVGVIVGSGLGGTCTFEDQVNTLIQKGPRRLSPFFISMVLPDSAAARLAIEYGYRGPSMSVTSACASGNNAIGEAFEMIARGAADVVLAGSAEAPLNLTVMGGFAIMKALSTDNDEPQKASRPFDATRNGFVPAEGAGILVLESLAHAKARQADIYAELVGYGTSVDAYHMVAPEESGTGAALAMQAALRRANLNPGDIDYVNAHGTSTALNDSTETLALKTVLGQHAYTIPISSSKSMTGHLLGGAGALEAVICVKTIETGIITPTINYHHPDPSCDLNYTPNQAVTQSVDTVMSNGFGFGGHNASIIIKRYSAN